jgi:hypothetical protein
MSRSYGSSASQGSSHSSQHLFDDIDDDAPHDDESETDRDSFPPQQSKRRASKGKGKRASESVAAVPTPAVVPLSGTLMRELGQSRRQWEQLRYALDGAEAASLSLRRSSMWELARYCEQSDFVDALRISSELLPRTLAAVRMCVASSDAELCALAVATALRLHAGTTGLADSPEFVRVLVAMQQLRGDATPAQSQNSLGFADAVVAPVAVKKRRSFVVPAAATGTSAANDVEASSGDATAAMFASIDACGALAAHKLRGLPLSDLLPRIGTVLLCQTGSRLEAAALRDVMRECGALTSMAREWARAVKCVTADEPCGVAAIDLCAFFECMTFDNVYNQNELLDSPGFVTSVTTLLRFLDDGARDDDLQQACLRVLLNVSNHNDLGGQALLGDAALVQLLLRRLSVDEFDQTIQIVALLINCVETSAERCRALLAYKVADAPILSELVRLYKAIGAGAADDGEQTPRRVLQSYVVLLLGSLCVAGSDVRSLLETHFAASADGSSGLIPLARLLESFLSFQLNNGILTHDLYEQASVVARRLRGAIDDDDEDDER